MKCKNTKCNKEFTGRITKQYCSTKCKDLSKSIRNHRKNYQAIPPAEYKTIDEITEQECIELNKLREEVMGYLFSNEENTIIVKK